MSFTTNFQQNKLNVLVNFENKMRKKRKKMYTFHILASYRYEFGESSAVTISPQYGCVVQRAVLTACCILIPTNHIE